MPWDFWERQVLITTNLRAEGDSTTLTQQPGQVVLQLEQVVLQPGQVVLQSSRTPNWETKPHRFTVGARGVHQGKSTSPQT